jgi:hypothetical protein
MRYPVLFVMLLACATLSRAAPEQSNTPKPLAEL